MSLGKKYIGASDSASAMQQCADVLWLFRAFVLEILLKLFFVIGVLYGVAGVLPFLFPQFCFRRLSKKSICSRKRFARICQIEIACAGRRLCRRMALQSKMQGTLSHQCCGVYSREQPLPTSNIECGSGNSPMPKRSKGVFNHNIRLFDRSGEGLQQTPCFLVELYCQRSMYSQKQL